MENGATVLTVTIAVLVKAALTESVTVTAWLPTVRSVAL
jgi:hypothetical protein